MVERENIVSINYTYLFSSEYHTFVPIHPSVPRGIALDIENIGHDDFNTSREIQFIKLVFRATYKPRVRVPRRRAQHTGAGVLVNSNARQYFGASRVVANYKASPHRQR